MLTNKERYLKACKDIEKIQRYLWQLADIELSNNKGNDNTVFLYQYESVNSLLNKAVIEIKKIKGVMK